MTSNVTCNVTKSVTLLQCENKSVECIQFSMMQIHGEILSYIQNTNLKAEVVFRMKEQRFLFIRTLYKDVLLFSVLSDSQGIELLTHRFYHDDNRITLFIYYVKHLTEIYNKEVEDVNQALS